MGVRSKTFLTIALVGVVVGLLIYQINNKNLFQGQIFTEGENLASSNENIKLPDLTAKLEVLPLAAKDEDIKISATIKNGGEGEVSGERPFKYAIFINDTEVFSNTDSYSVMSSGDSFSFEYPISRALYQYKDSGKIKFVVDADNDIEESDEANNMVEEEYSF